MLDSLSALHLEPAASLPIRRPEGLPNKLLSFRDHKTVGSFAIDGEQKYVKGPPIMRLPATLTKLNIDLMKDQDKAVLFSNYNAYGMFKHECFFKWLLDEYMTSDGGPFAHDFIGIAGRFTEILKTPFVRLNDKFRNGEWRIHAVKFNGSIFLLNAMMSQDAKDVGVTTIGLYCGRQFRHILTTDDCEGKYLNAYAKSYVFRESNFGKHKILCLKEMDAIDDNKDYVKMNIHVQPWSHYFMKLNRLRYWAQCVPAGVDKLALGKRSKGGILTSIRVMQTRDLKKSNDDEWKPYPCYEFADRMFEWIKSHFVEDDPTVVKKFRWCLGMKEAEVVDTQYVDVACLLLPDWFVEGVEAKRRATQ